MRGPLGVYEGCMSCVLCFDDALFIRPCQRAIEKLLQCVSRHDAHQLGTAAQCLPRHDAHFKT